MVFWQVLGACSHDTIETLDDVLTSLVESFGGVLVVAHLLLQIG